MSIITPEQFQQCRNDMGLTRNQLADLLGYSNPDQDQNIIRRLETGKRDISPMCARLLAMIYRHWRATGNFPEFL